MDGLKITNGISRIDSANSLKESLLSEIKGPQAGSAEKSGFAATLKDAINSVDKLQKTADVEMQNLATGKSQNLHETMIAAEKAEIALRLMVQVRNKMIEAYQDIMRMQV